MRIAAVADIHLGNHGVMGGPVIRSMNARCWLILDTIKLALETAKMNGCSYFVIVGDLFDTIKPLPQMVGAVSEMFRDCGMAVIVLVGNHEHVSSADNDNSLVALSSVSLVQTPKRVTIIDRGDRVELLCIPCVPHAAYKWFDAEVAKLADTIEDKDVPCVLCFHLGIADMATSFYLQGAKDAVKVECVLAACQRHGIKTVFAGNWHNQQVWEETVYQLGALVPTGFDNPGVDGYGGLAIYDSLTQQTQLLQLPGPRFIPLHVSDDVTIVAAAHAAGHLPFVRLTCRPDELSVAENLLADFRTRGVIYDGMTIPDKAAQREVAQQVATQVQNAGSLQEAVVAAVAAQTLPATINKQDVVSRLSAYLNC